MTKRVLIVDPNYNMLALIKVLLGNKYMITCVTSREQAILQLAKLNFELMTTNLVPEDTFPDFMKRVRVMRPNLKIVLVTGSPDAGKTTGIDGFVEKPDLSSLAQTVSTLLGIT